MSQLLTWSTRVIEAVLPLLLLTPFVRRQARWVAIALVIALHVGFCLFMNLGIFVPAMLVFTPFLVPASDWDRLERLWARSIWRESPAAFARAVAVLEGRGLLGPRRRSSTRRRLRPGAASFSARAREGAVLALMACATGGAIFDNSGSTHAPAALEPRAVSAVLGYLQMYQVWTMFAPDVPTTAKTVAVDAVTADGRHVDPLNEALSPGHPLTGWRDPAAVGEQRLRVGVSGPPSVQPRLLHGAW